MTHLAVGEVDDLTFIAEGHEQVQGVFEAYRAGKLLMDRTLTSALKQMGDELSAIRLDDWMDPEASNLRDQACGQIAQMLWETPAVDPGLPQPAMPPSHDGPRFRARNVIIGLIGAFALLLAVPTFGIPLVVHRSHPQPPSPPAPATKVATGGTPASATPSFDSLLSLAPARGFVPDRQAKLRGYLNQTEVTALFGSALPPDAQVYLSPWKGPGRAEMVEGAVLTASPTDAVKFATVLLNSIITKSAQRFSIPGLAGAAGGVTVPATGAQQPKAFVDVARSRVALFFAAASGDSNTSRSLASRAAQITADVLPVDPGHI